MHSALLHGSASERLRRTAHPHQHTPAVHPGLGTWGAPKWPPTLLGPGVALPRGWDDREHEPRGVRAAGVQGDVVVEDRGRTGIGIGVGHAAGAARAVV